MSDAQLSSEESLPPEAALRLNEACNRFEAAWRTGPPPHLEDYLPAEDAPERSALLGELMALELHYRRRQGDLLQLEDYQARFPTLDPQWLARKLAGSTRAGEEQAGGATVVPDRLRCGDYELLQELGRGGMGVVYKARQTGLNRIVALKMIRAGPFASGDEVQRFRREAEAAARLHHPHIVQIHEIGEYDGRPFLTLEYVDGASLEERLFEGRAEGRMALTPQESARLATTLARAVHYAHQQGVVHRDLKPANILLRKTEGNGAGSWELDPKVADFGLAMFLDAAADQTRSGAVLGTPSYMAPEQAAGKREAVGPATDVYALGVILYELLTGRLPFQGATVAETLEQVRSAEPVPPRRLQPRLPRDLETVCLKCLHKDPSRRYASAGDLAEDLDRFLSGQPTLARPVSRPEHLWRWCRRNPAVASLVAALFVVLVGGLVTATALWLRADQQRRHAEAQRRQALDNLKLAREAADNYATRVSDNLRLQQVDLRPLRKELLETVVPFYEKLIEGYADDREIQAERGKAHFRLGLLTAEVGDRKKAAELFERAADIFQQLANEHDEWDYHVETAKAYNDLAISCWKMGRNDEAEKAYGRAIAIRQDLVRRRPDDADNRKSLARYFNNLGNLFGSFRGPAEVEEAFQQALAIGEQLVREDPENPEYQRELGLTYSNRGILHLAAAGNRVKAAASLESARKIFEALLARPGAERKNERELARCLMHLGYLHDQGGQGAKAFAAYSQATDLLERITRDDASLLDCHHELAGCHYTVGMHFHYKAQPDKAEAAYLKSVSLAEAKLSPYYSAVPAYQVIELKNYIQLGPLYRAWGRPEKAGTAYLKAVELAERASENHPGDAECFASLIEASALLADWYQANGGPDKALAVCRKTLAVAEKRVDEHRGQHRFLSGLATMHENVGIHLDRAKNPDEGVKSYEKAIEILEQLVRDHSKVLHYHVQLADSYTNLGRLHRNRKKPTDAVAACQTAIRHWELLARDDEKNLELAVKLGGAYGDMGFLLLDDTNKQAEALEWYQRAIARLEAVWKEQPWHAEVRQFLRNSLATRARLLTDLNRPAEAVPDFDRAIELFPETSRPRLRARRARALALDGHHARATQEAEALTVKPPPWNNGYYDLACVFSLSVLAARKDVALPSPDRYAARAVELLTRARETGDFKTVERLEKLKTDRDLDPLRSGPEFQRFLADTEGKAKR